MKRYVRIEYEGNARLHRAINFYKIAVEKLWKNGINVARTKKGRKERERENRKRNRKRDDAKRQRIQLNSRGCLRSLKDSCGCSSRERGQRRNWFLRVRGRVVPPVHKACIINTVLASLRLRVFGSRVVGRRWWNVSDRSFSFIRSAEWNWPFICAPWSSLNVRRMPSSSSLSPFSPRHPPSLHLNYHSFISLLPLLHSSVQISRAIFISAFNIDSS